MRNRLRFAISTEIFDSEISFPERFRKISSFGVRNVLLCVRSIDTIDDLIKAHSDFKSLGLRCVQVKSCAMPKSYTDEKHFEEAIEEISKLSDIIKLYGGNQIELTAGSFRGHKPEHLEAAVKFLKQACEIAQENNQYCALDFTPKKNQLIKTWDEMKTLYEKTEKENLLININMALLHHLKISEEEMKFLDGKSALIEIEDILGDKWVTDINLGEGAADLKALVALTQEYLINTCEKTGSYPAALLVLNSYDKSEIIRTLSYFESVLPYVRL